MSSTTPMFPGWNTLAGRAAKRRLTRAEEQRRSLCAQGLPGMRSLLEGLMDPNLLITIPRPSHLPRLTPLNLAIHPHDRIAFLVYIPHRPCTLHPPTPANRQVLQTITVTPCRP